MNNILIKIGKVIESVAIQEDAELKEFASEGIFFMPELAFVYACGKSIMAKRTEIFGELVVKWKREENIGNGGPTDLIFELGKDKCIAIEFKLRDTRHAYIKDIDKLMALKRSDPERFVTAFCALVDTYADQIPDDGRVGAVEAHPSAKVVSLLEPKPHFETIQHRYTLRDVRCVVGFWCVDFKN